MTFAFLLPTPRFIYECGEYNGYVGFDDKLPLSYQGKAFETEDSELSLDDYIQVHGGITWDSENYRLTGDPIKLTEFPENWKDCRIIGFDTCHFGDDSVIWDKEAVTHETLRLKEQIDKLIKDGISNSLKVLDI